MTPLPDDVMQCILDAILLSGDAGRWGSFARACRRTAVLCRRRRLEAMCRFAQFIECADSSWWRLPCGLFHGLQQLAVRFRHNPAIACTLSRNWIAGRIQGLEETTVDRTGLVVHRVWWLDGQRHGLEQRWDVNSASDAPPQYEMNWQAGEKHGVELTRFGSGGVASSIEWYAGQRHGLACLYHVNGPLVMQRSYVRDRVHGKEIHNFADGKLQRVVHWSNNHKDGLEIDYYWGAQKRIARQRAWKNGLLHGVEKRFTRGGTVRYLAEYSDGLLHGLRVISNGKGKRPRVEYWNRGVQGNALVALDANGMPFAAAVLPVPVK